MSKHISLTPKQKNSLHMAVSNPMRPPPFALRGAANPKMRVVTIHFDGTQNDKDKVSRGEMATLVAESHDQMKVDDGLASFYYAGVGTKTNKAKGMLESGLGIGAATRAEAAYADLCEQASKWRKEDPECEVHVHIVGFSRGAGIGVHFMNMVHERGIRSKEKKKEPFKGMEPGHVKTSAVLLDAVTTGNGALKLTRPESNLCTLHVTAGGEERLSFPLTTMKDSLSPDNTAMVMGHYNGASLPEATPVAYNRMEEIVLEGARHSDVGGSYPKGDIRKISKYLMGQFQRSLGLPVTALRPTFEDIERMHANDSRFNYYKLIDPFLTEEQVLERRQAAERVVIHRGQRVWEGDIAMSCHLVNGFDIRHASLLGHRYQRLETENTLDPEDHTLIEQKCQTPDGQSFRDEDFDCSQRFTIKKNKQSGEIEVLGGKEGDILFGSDGQLQYRGIPFPESLSLDRIVESLKDVDPDDGLMLDLVIKRSTPIFNVGHLPMNEDGMFEADWLLQGMSHQADPWPVEVRNILLQLNNPEEMLSRPNPPMMKYQAMEALSNRLMTQLNRDGQIIQTQDNDPSGCIVSIRIKSSEVKGKQGPFHIEMLRGDGSTITSDDHRRMKASEFEMIIGMESIQRAMTMICNGMERNRLGVARSIDQVFEFNPDIKNNTVLDLREPLSESMKRRIDQEIEQARAQVDHIKNAQKSGDFLNRLSISMSKMIEKSVLNQAGKKQSKASVTP